MNKLLKRIFRSETRASYTDAAIAAIISKTIGTAARPENTAAAEIAASSLSRALALATVSPDVPELRGLSSRVLWDIGRRLMLYGESLHHISVASGRAVLTRAALGWSVTGGADELTWRYLISLAAPTDQVTINVPSAAVVHCRYSLDDAQPHIGISPFGSAAITAAMAAHLEVQLKDEVSAPSGYVLPAPINQIGQEVIDLLTTKLRALRGHTAIVPSMVGAWGDGGAQGRADWTPKRLGAAPPDAVVNLRKSVTAEMLAAAGIPPELWSDGISATGRREAWRQFLHGTIRPIADILQTEFRAKLHPDCTLSFDRLFASDIQGRARAFQSLVSGGMELTQAAAASGILQEE